MVLLPVFLVIAILYITYYIIRGNNVPNPFLAIISVVWMLICILGIIIGGILAVVAFCVCAGLAGMVLLTLLSAICPGINTAQGFGHIQGFWVWFIGIYVILTILLAFVAEERGVNFSFFGLIGIILSINLHSWIMVSGFTLVNILLIVLLCCLVVLSFGSLKRPY
jgi:hypothetical protein